MRLVATSDTHYPVDVKKWIPDGDVFVHAGDAMRTGYLDEWNGLLDWFGQLPHKLKLFIPGNHDFHLQVYPGPALQQLRERGVWVVGMPGNDHYAAYKLPNGMSLLGLPCVTNLSRWAFNSSEERITDFLKRIGNHDIVVSHAPIHGVLDYVPPKEGFDGKNVGIKAHRRYALKAKPKHWIHGHIHECYGNETFHDTEVHNVAMCNRDYVHANKPLVLDL